MRKIIALLIASVLFSFCNAQEQLPTEKKVVFGQTEKMYINKDLGLYLWLSTSPDENAPKHRLLSDSTNKYSNPMFLDTEGYNTLRSPSAVDPVSRKTVFPMHDIIFEVYSDGKTPVTKHKLVSGKSIYRSGKLYYGNGKVAFSLSAKDIVSGISKTYFSINEKSYSEILDTIKIVSEGETTLKYYSTDKVGNREEPVVKKFVVDNSAPKTNYEIEGIQNEKYVSAKAVIKLNSVDNLVGVKTVYYKINNSTRQVYTRPVSVQKLGPGGTMSFYAIDYLNNTEEIQVIGGTGNNTTNEDSDGSSFEFYVDNAAPTINIEIDGEHSKGKYSYVSANTKLKVNAEDDKSGVDKIYYSINNYAVDQQYADDIQFTNEGIAYIRINAVDYVGNKSTTVTNAYFVDATTPTTKVTIAQPKHKVKDTLFITSKTKFKLSSIDNASGVKAIKYSIGDKQEEQYNESFTIAKNGLTEISYRGFDNVNNIEETNTLDVFVDNVPPIIYNHFSNTSIGSKTVRDHEFTIYPSDVKLYIAATDEASGGERIEYSINNGATKSVNPIKDLAPGNYEVVVTAYDVLGNSSQQTIKFSVEK